ncbi:hypothetical protein [Merismopedia glauca]|uniref:hypothetical protein n=1 Tax=Merismopedia glauca TaxID=292586 RepID=UPI0015E6C74E|nr:hypothetical protein [Merismopedia glauca]
MTKPEIEQYFFQLALNQSYSPKNAELIAKEIIESTQSEIRYFRAYYEMIYPLIKDIP